MHYSTGCGSGRYLHINKKIYKVGLDICCPLVEAGRSKGYEVMVADNLRLPFVSNVFDAVISIGVIHHFSTHSRRVEAVQELARLLRPGGQLMIYVWAYEQKHRRVCIPIPFSETLILDYDMLFFSKYLVTRTRRFFNDYYCS